MFGDVAFGAMLQEISRKCLVSRLNHESKIGNMSWHFSTCGSRSLRTYNIHVLDQCNSAVTGVASRGPWASHTALPVHNAPTSFPMPVRSKANEARPLSSSSEGIPCNAFAQLSYIKFANSPERSMGISSQFSYKPTLGAHPRTKTPQGMSNPHVVPLKLLQSCTEHCPNGKGDSRKT